MSNPGAVGYKPLGNLFLGRLQRRTSKAIKIKVTASVGTKMDSILINGSKPVFVNTPEPLLPVVEPVLVVLVPS